MARAVELGRGGDPSPNPHVGAVVAVGEEIIGEGLHRLAGEDHAEIAALRAAGERARGATLYVTLEPCNHQGRTAPCVDAILAAGVRRVVVGCSDPNPHVAGGGLARLREAGLEVVSSVLEGPAAELIAPWAHYITEGASYLSLKVALSLDGRIATRTGQSRWITGPDSRARVHALRAAHDAVLVGVNTVATDDPLLTVRDAPGRSPIRVVVDSKLRTPVGAQIVVTAREVPTCIVTTTEASAAAAHEFEALGVAIVRVPATPAGLCDMPATLRALAAREVVSVLCEGGAELAGSLLAGRLPAELHAFIAPVLLGPRGIPGAVDWAGPEVPSQAPRIEPPVWELCGRDAYVHGPLVYPARKPPPREA
ncbi:MAG: bifunctional diaminohydroxyphosphoribosylaminopyrimidine deaminase/5-amino-6-(5-phosphoribosylamino)uracil reductase RibD [Deltaproteobacteria bacterium]|nr:bifunctional diaminohydroxyphosphoribosylaminopyrimidine deaminase/5-amino-6-(5-phosphoribosylamino)uracil reductase RibD [Deltaproteobacteria bacterium]